MDIKRLSLIPLHPLDIRILFRYFTQYRMDGAVVGARAGSVFQFLNALYLHLHTTRHLSNLFQVIGDMLLP